jgi:DNA polymerase I
MKRSDSAPITREVQERVLEMILKGNGKIEVKEYLPEVLRMYRAGRCPLEKAGIPSGINKSLDDYTVLDAHGRGAKYSNTYLGTDFKRGSKPKRLYINRPSYNPNTDEKFKQNKLSFLNISNNIYPDTDVICFEYPDQVPPELFRDIDWETMLEKTIKAPLIRIFEALGWDWSEFDSTKRSTIEKTKNTALDMFF